MSTNRRMPQICSTAACLAALIALTSGTALAAIPNTTAYQFSSHPMISGTVVTVNDHQMVVDTDQGEQVALEVDSRTMAPRDLAPGMVMRVDFLALEDCRFYAQRVLPIRGGVSTDRLQAYANTRDSQEMIARNSSGLGGYREVSSVTPAQADMRETHPQTIGEHSPGTVMIAKPTTADYQFSTRSMISGRVVSVNDHRLVVDTDQGQRIGMVMDSRTMVPGEVAAGTVMRAEFTQLQDGRYYAKRVSPVTSGVAEREQAFAHTRDSDIALARNSMDCGFVTIARPSPMTTIIERQEPVAVPPPAVIRQDPAPVEETPETLPQTAGRQPLLLLFGLLALGSAGVVAVARDRRIV